MLLKAHANVSDVLARIHIPVFPAPSPLLDAFGGSTPDAPMALPTLLCLLLATCAQRCCVVFRSRQHLQMLLCYLCNILHWHRRLSFPVWLNVGRALHHHLDTLVTHQLPEVVEHLPFADFCTKATPRYTLFHSEFNSHPFACAIPLLRMFCAPSLSLCTHSFCPLKGSQRMEYA